MTPLVENEGKGAHERIALGIIEYSEAQRQQIATFLGVDPRNIYPKSVEFNNMGSAQAPTTALERAARVLFEAYHHHILSSLGLKRYGFNIGRKQIEVESCGDIKSEVICHTRSMELRSSDMGLLRAFEKILTLTCLPKDFLDTVEDGDAIAVLFGRPFEKTEVDKPLDSEHVQVRQLVVLDGYSHWHKIIADKDVTGDDATAALGKAKKIFVIGLNRPTVLGPEFVMPAQSSADVVTAGVV